MESFTVFFGGASFPRVGSAETTSTTNIQFIFNEDMTVTTAGWSFTQNGSPLTLTSVSGSGTTWTFVVGVISAGDVILWNYNSATGNTVSDPAGIELPTKTDQPVTNNVSFEAETIAYMVALVIPYDTTVYFTGTAQQRTGTQLWAAVNNFVLSLKGASIYSKMKAVYPMLGGTSARAKFNLIDPRDLDAAYRLTFSGPWVFSGTGALPDMTTTYANTYLAPSAVLGLNSTHLSYYSRTNVSSLQVEMGVEQPASNYTLLEINTSGSTYFLLNQAATPTYADNNSYGYYIGNRQASNDMDGWKNGVKVLNGTAVSTSLPTNPIYIGAYNGVLGIGLVTSKECAMSTIGDGLTDADALALSNAVETFNVTLSRSTPPQILSATAIDATHIEYVFDQDMSVTLAGWSFTLNGSPLSASSVTGVTDTWTFEVGTMANGDTISSDYAVASGATVSAVTGIELIEAIYPVTNSIPSAGATLVQAVASNPFSGSGSLAFTSNNTAGNLLVAYYMGTIGAFGNTVADTQANANWTLGAKSNQGFGNDIEVWYCWNCAAGANTVNGTGIGANVNIYIEEWSGVKSSADPLLDFGIVDGSVSPLQVSLNPTSAALILMGWYNGGTDDYTGLVSGLTLGYHETVGNYMAVANNPSASTGAQNVGITTGGDASNVLGAIALELL